MVVPYSHLTMYMYLKLVPTMLEDVIQEGRVWWWMGMLAAQGESKDSPRAALPLALFLSLSRVWSVSLLSKLYTRSRASFSLSRPLPLSLIVFEISRSLVQDFYPANQAAELRRNLWMPFPYPQDTRTRTSCSLSFSFSSSLSLSLRLFLLTHTFVVPPYRSHTTSKAHRVTPKSSVAWRVRVHETMNVKDKELSQKFPAYKFAGKLFPFFFHLDDQG